MVGTSPPTDDNTFLDRVFANYRLSTYQKGNYSVIRDPQLEDSYLGRQLAAAWPLYMTNAIFLTVFGINPLLLITSDFECTCGACMKCQANIKMLDHSLDVAGYRMRMHLKTFAAHLYAGLSA